MGKKVNLNQKRTNSDMTKLNKNKNLNSRRVYNEFTKINSQPRSIENDNYQDLQDSREKNEISNVKIRIPLSIKMLATIVIFVPLLILMLFVTVFGDFGEGSSSGIGLSGYDYYAGACDKVRVKGNLVSMEEYVAGVIAVEVTGFTDETLKAIAIGARTYVIANAKKVGDDNNCYYDVTNTSASFQAYTNKVAAEQYKNAANATRGLIITVDGKPKGNYDASCIYTAAQARAKSPEQEFDDNYYYIKYGGWTIGGDNYQKVEKDKALSVGSFEYYLGHTLNGSPCYSNHGGGMSQNGAGYLEKYNGYNYEQIIDYFFQDKEKLVSIYKGATSAGSYSGDYPIEPNNELYSNNKFLINTTISNVLSNNGSSLEKFNENLKSEIEKAGVGTREASVAAAVTLIGSLAEQGYKIYYQWGGIHPRLGLDSNYGTLIDNREACTSYESVNPKNPKKCINFYKWYGFDCGGFVEWAIYNGTQGSKAPTGAKVSRAAIFSYSENSKISLKSDKAVCKIGGVLDSANHITLIVGHDDANKRYIVAEAAGADLATGKGGVRLEYYPYGSKGFWCSNLDKIYGD